MLDDLKYIHQRDQQDALDIVAKQPNQLLHEFTITPAINHAPINNIVYIGMGNAAIAAQVALATLKITVPFEIVRGYDLPHYIGPNTLLIAATYSGDERKVDAVIAHAKTIHAQVVIITNGSSVTDNADASITLPAGDHSTLIWAGYKALLTLLNQYKVLSDSPAYFDQLAEATKFSNEAVQSWAAIMPTSKNLAKQVALELIGQSVVIYSGSHLVAAALNWKIGCNQHAKHIAWTGQYPEAGQDEFVGWSKQPVDKPYAVIDLRSPFDDPQIQKQFELSERLLSGLRPAPITITAQGDTILQQLLWTMVLGDFTTIYLALLNGLNPVQTDLAETLKKKLNES